MVSRSLNGSSDFIESVQHCVPQRAADKLVAVLHLYAAGVTFAGDVALLLDDVVVHESSPARCAPESGRSTSPQRRIAAGNAFSPAACADSWLMSGDEHDASASQGESLK